MALIKCPECGKEISDKADTCPSCGGPVNGQKSIVVKKDYKSKAKLCMIIGIVVFLLSGVLTMVTTGFMTGLKAQYIMSGNGAYLIFDFLLDVMTWIGIILFIVGIVYKIKSLKNKN